MSPVPRIVLAAAVLLGLLIAALPAAAQQAPPNPGDFVVALQPAGAPSTEPPDCDPALSTIGPTTAFPVLARCTDTTAATGQTQRGTASNPTLAASTGDPGFTNGTVTAVCDITQTYAFTLEITATGSTMQRFGGTFFQACAFQLVFADAQQSTLSGTIEANGRLGGADGAVVGNAVQVDVDAKVFVTGGTGAFAGYVGSGSFAQTETIDLSAPAGGGGGANPQQAFCTANGIADCSQAGIAAWCQLSPANQAACQSLPRAARQAAAGDTMKLRLVRKPGRVRILSPAPPAGRPGAPARVRARTKVELAASAGAVCTVTANTGAVVGSGTATGRYGAITITPKAGAYADATSIQARCRTKAGRNILSNRVQIRLLRS